MSFHRRILNLLRPEGLSREIDREVSFHLAERVDDLMLQGLSEAEAMREAKRRFGNEVFEKERTRDANVLGWLETLVGDVRYGLRSLLAAPGFALVAVISLGLGIGANAAIFNLVDAVILRSLPVRHPEQLAQVKIDDRDSYTNAIWEMVRDRQNAFDGVFAWGNPTFNLASGGEARRVNGNWVSGAYFSTLGVRPAAGRLLQEDDDTKGCAPVAVLSHALWQREYGGNPSAIGRMISLDGHSVPIVGVADRSFYGLDVGRRADVYVPLCSEATIRGANSALNRKTTWFMRVMGRMKAGATIESTNTALLRTAPGVMAASVPETYTGKNRDHFLQQHLVAVPAASGLSYLRHESSKALYVLMGIVAVVLLIACANVANLLLARSTVRYREMAVRLAIGASRGRIVRQLLTESLLLSTLGAAVGILFANWGARLLVTMMSTSTQRVDLDVGMDWRVLTFAIVVATVTGLLFGVVPSWRASRAEPQAAMKANSRSVVEGGTRFSLGKALVIAQIALSLSLITGAGLLLGTFRKLATLDTGFRTDGVLIANMDISTARVPPSSQRVLYQSLMDRARALPGVTDASIALNTPVSQNYYENSIVVDGFTPASENDSQVYTNEVSDGYFRTLGTRLLMGRDFAPADLPNSPRVVVVNEEVMHKFYGNSSPVGKVLHFGSAKEPGPEFRVIGVVENTKYGDLREEVQPIVYRPFSQDSAPGDYVSIAMHANGSPTALLAGVRRMLHDVNPDFTVDFVALDTQVAQSLLRERMLALLSAFFGALALALAVIGLYGIMSYSVARRRNEIGIRIALGSARERVLAMVLGEVGRMVAAGLIMGTALALLTARVVESFLFGVQPNDPRTLILSCAVLAVVALAAGALPAWRAARLDPMTALREE
jgi:predicted permease